MKKPTDKEEAIKQIVKWQDVCPKSFDGRHIFAEGELKRPLVIFGLVLPISKIVLKLDICRACGVIKRK